MKNNSVCHKCNNNVITNNHKCNNNVITFLSTLGVGLGCVLGFEQPAFAFTLLNVAEQGGLVYGQADKNEQIQLDDKIISTNSNGGFVFALGQDAPSTITLKSTKNKQKQAVTVKVSPRVWKEEVVNGLPPSKVTLSPEDEKRVEQESKLIKSARNTANNKADFPMCFSRPVSEKARISSMFGSRRVLNGVKTSGHSGTDYALPTGSEITSPQDGVVIFTYDDMFYSGKTVLIDHGYGVVSSYSHMNSISVQQNQRVNRGQPIGTIGTTGRSTGPHLHFIISWQDVRIDPEQALQIFPCDK